MNIPSAAAITAANSAAASSVAANSAAASSVAGTSRAAAKGGTSDQTAIDSQDSAHKTKTGGVEKADATAKTDMDADRDADGRQVLDVFESHEEDGNESEDSATEEANTEVPPNRATDGHLDLEM